MTHSKSTSNRLKKAVHAIRRPRKRKYASEEKIRIVLEGLRRKRSVADLCRKEGISVGQYNRWSYQFLEAGKKGLGRDASLEQTLGVAKKLREESATLKQKLAELMLENSLLKKAYEKKGNMIYRLGGPKRERLHS